MRSELLSRLLFDRTFGGVPDRFDDVPDRIKSFAILLSLVLNALGFGGDKVNPLLDRANKIVKVIVIHIKDTVKKPDPEGLDNFFAEVKDSLKEDDLDAYSVAVGFAVACNIYSQLEMNDTLTPPDDVDPPADVNPLADKMRRRAPHN